MSTCRDGNITQAPLIREFIVAMLKSIATIFYGAVTLLQTTAFFY